jgi:hypothetical protein
MAESLETIQKILEEVKEEKSPEEKVKELDTLADELRKERQNHEKRWYLIDRFLRGNHFEIWRPATNEIGKVVFPKGINVRPIHYAIRVAEGIMNTLLASDPRWKVFPIGLSQIKDEEERKRKIENTKKIAAFFDNLFDAENLREKLSEMVWNGIKYGFGVIEIYWDGKPKFRVIDNFDILFDPTVKDIQDSPYIIKEVAVDLERVKANPNYNENRFELKEENKISGSSFKETQLKERFGGKLAEKKVLIRECWIENPNGGWDVIHICQKKILFEEHYDFRRPPFVSWSFLPETLLQTSFVERMIPLNRALDITLAQIEAWVRSVAVGRMLKQKTVNVNRILGEHGEIIEVNGPLDSIAWLKVQEIGGTVFNFLNELKSLMGETAAATAAMGRVPKGAKVGYKLIESLKSAEISSIQHGVRKLEGTLERLGETTLMLIYYFGTTPIEAKYKDEYFEIVGAQYAGGYANAIPVSDTDFGIDVSIESGLAYTTEAKRALAIELAKAKLIDRKTALEILNLGGDTEEIAQRALEEMEKEEKIQQGKITSVLDADDFQKLSDETKRRVLQELLGQT